MNSSGVLFFNPARYLLITLPSLMDWQQRIIISALLRKNVNKKQVSEDSEGVLN